ncbi:hypothetical protein IEO21_04047 [Rhodonia placenta]|uniref:Thioredoxin-like fold domain-containing protein n=1 Tax=Rhodonia placenta TaxID=104341 RepID=A0A8H7U3D5_9APHY|nr:hypothetical protein IEO21_04047 [Postia placenta]
MALQPSLRGLVIAGTWDSPHTLDIFLDYVCPYSAKIALAIDGVLKPLLGPGGKYAGKVKVIFRPQVQPWHASSTYVHEAGLAVARVAPESFWTFSLALFKRQVEYFDVATSTQTPLQIRENLAALAGETLNASQTAAFKSLLAIRSDLGQNGGTDVTDDLKYTVKFARQNSVHVSPSALWDGLLQGDVSSSWGEKEWTGFLEKKVIV